MFMTREPRFPVEPTIVFAGVQSQNMRHVMTAGVTAMMFSWASISSAKKVKVAIADGLPNDPVTYLDSGVFTFMRRAGVTSLTREGNKDASWESFRAMAATYIAYLKEHREEWDWIIELDCDEVFGIERADAFRRNLRNLVGDRLLPVWHAQRGQEGWQEMIREYRYVCISPSTALGRRSRVGPMIREMIRDAHARGTYVHLLGNSSISTFQNWNVDSLDSSAWAAGARWGELKIWKGAVTFPKYETKVKRPIKATQIMQVEDLVKQWGFTLQDMVDDHHIRSEVGARLMLMRQEELRARKRAKAVS